MALSPLGLSGLDGDLTQADWTRLSDVGQTYGAVSAIIAAIALVGIVISLIIQSREAKAARVSTLRALHVELLRMSMDDPVYMECWGEYLTDSFRRERQYAYTNLIINHWHSMYELGECTDDMLSAMCAEVFSGAPGRHFWQHAGPGLRERAPNSRARRFYRLIDDAYHAALERPVAAPPDDATTISAPEPHPATAGKSGNRILLIAVCMAALSLVFRAIRHIMHRAR